MRFSFLFTIAILFISIILAGCNKANTNIGIKTTNLKHMSHIVPVYYGTNRRQIPTKKKQMYNRFSGEYTPNLTLGRVIVTIPPNHSPGVIERPKWTRLEFEENEESHISIRANNKFTQKEFQEELARQMGEDFSRAIMVFVHGYNVGFDEAAMRTAELAYDLRFPAVPAMFSWPSDDKVFKYASDANEVNLSKTKFRKFLESLVKNTGAETIHIIAHSMGARIVADVASTRMSDYLGENITVRQIILVAPDIDARLLPEISDSLNKNAERITLYVSEQDIALNISHSLYGFPRAGNIRDGISRAIDIDTIDVSKVEFPKRDILNHSYFNSSLADLSELLKYGLHPDNRKRLSKIEDENGRYWFIDPKKIYN